MIGPIYSARRANVSVQVFARMYPEFDITDSELEEFGLVADEVFTSKICDLDWEAAMLRHLGYTGATL